jgi:hypothetical protein
MIVKSTLLAVVVFFGSLALAEGQVYISGGVPSPGTALGWNFGRIAYCTTYYDGLTTWYYAFFPDGGYAYTNNPGFTTLAGSACQTGNLAGIHVTRLIPFQWNGVATFPFK